MFTNQSYRYIGSHIDDEDNAVNLSGLLEENGLDPNLSTIIPETDETRVNDDIPNDWLERLIQIFQARENLKNERQNIEAEMQRHLTYSFSLSGILSASLREIYQSYIRCDVKHQAKMDLYIDEVIEDISHCSQGFHSRVNKCINRFKNLKHNFITGVYQYRLSIIEEAVALRYAGVHHLNVMTRWAGKMGFGIRCTFEQDRYIRPAELDDQDILHEHIQKKYTLSKVYKHVYSEIKDCLVELGYEGENIVGYELSVYDSILNCIKEYFNATPSYSDILIMDDKSNVVDINWSYVKDNIFERILVSQDKDVITYYEKLIQNKEFDIAADLLFFITTSTRHSIKKFESCRINSYFDDVLKNLEHIEDSATLNRLYKKLKESISKEYFISMNTERVINILLNKLNEKEMTMILNQLSEGTYYQGKNRSSKHFKTYHRLSDYNKQLYVNHLRNANINMPLEHLVFIVQLTTTSLTQDKTTDINILARELMMNKKHIKHLDDLDLILRNISNHQLFPYRYISYQGIKITNKEIESTQLICNIIGGIDVNGLQKVLKHLEQKDEGVWKPQGFQKKFAKKIILCLYEKLKLKSQPLSFANYIKSLDSKFHKTLSTDGYAIFKRNIIKLKKIQFSKPSDTLPRSELCDLEKPKAKFSFFNASRRRDHNPKVQIDKGSHHEL